MCDGDPEDFLVVYGLYLQDTFSRGEQDVRERVTLTVFRNGEEAGSDTRPDVAVCGENPNLMRLLGAAQVAFGIRPAQRQYHGR